MTIPNVTMRWCVRKATCKYCEQPIEQATPMVTVFFWNKGNGENRKWNSTYYYHPECWVKQGLDYLGRNPFVPITGRGRKANTTGGGLTLSQEDATRRARLINKFHSLNQRKNNVKGSFPEKVLVEHRLNRQMQEVMLDVALLGGVPQSWVEKL